MELKEIKQIVELMNKHDLSVFHLEREGVKIKLKKGADLDQIAKALSHLPSISAAAAPPAMAAIPAPAASPSPETEVTTPSPSPSSPGVEINAPMVGTYYAAPSPDDPPFVSVGQQVDENTVVCIIEAMKVMNEIKAEQKGKVLELLVENGTPVQYGEALIKIDPNG